MILATDHMTSPSNIVEKPTVEQQRHAAVALAVGASQQQHAERQHHDAVECDVGLAERVFEHVDFGTGRRRADDEEPEQRTEARNQDGRVEQELRPPNPDGRRPDHECDGYHQEGVEGDEEDICRPRERIYPMQPGVDADRRTSEVERERYGEAEPRRGAAYQAPCASQSPW